MIKPDHDFDDRHLRRREDRDPVITKGLVIGLIAIYAGIIGLLVLAWWSK